MANQLNYVFFELATCGKSNGVDISFEIVICDKSREFVGFEVMTCDTPNGINVLFF